MFILDTNVVSELRKGAADKPDPNVVRWASAIDVALQYVSTVTVMELERGVLRMERRDFAQGQRLRTWLERQVLPAFDRRILPVDLAVARACARLEMPSPRPGADAYIVATALVHGMTLVTRNMEDLEGTGVAVLNPWLS